MIEVQLLTDCLLFCYPVQPKIKDQPSQPSHKYIILSGSNSNFSPLNYTTTVYPHSYFNAKWLLNGTVVQQDTFIPMNATTVRDSFSQQVLNHDQISQTKELTIFNVTYSAVLRIPGDGPVTKDVYSEDNRTVLYHVLPFGKSITGSFQSQSFNLIFRVFC